MNGGRRSVVMAVIPCMQRISVHGEPTVKPFQITAFVPDVVGKPLVACAEVFQIAFRRGRTERRGVVGNDSIDPHILIDQNDEFPLVVSERLVAPIKRQTPLALHTVHVHHREAEVAINRYCTPDAEDVVRTGMHHRIVGERLHAGIVDHLSIEIPRVVMVAPYHQQQDIRLFQTGVQSFPIEPVVKAPRFESETAIPGHDNRRIGNAVFGNLLGKRFEFAVDVAAGDEGGDTEGRL